ncbi:tyrosine-type recombinase/integrase [Halopiger aswanensis]|uniref:Site-specific recombinase XerD n=1 Tax=Halopiger aswanensis TaxID=148449 RepID=A0A3R7HVA1_9EURY|nr:tyrosine-type recombinase/integrase [Halopiger aswanensis]RKD88555.1 site-specific recombinase XerD [Halopiger aswanensis]
MESSNSGPSPGGKPLETAAEEFVAERDGNYASNLEYCLDKWIDWTPDHVQALEDVSTRTMRNYASHLKRRVRADAISASTARTYYNYVSALLNRAVEVGDLVENPAEKREAKKLLPSETTNSGDQQFWQPEQRRAIVSYVDEQARAAIDDPEANPFEPVRNRALITTLAYTGVRGAEVLADYRDERRNGLRWHSVDLEAGVMTVLGKSQDREETALPQQAVAPLERLRTLVDPPADGWPVFPSRHPPSLYSAIEDAGYDKPDGDPWGFCLEHGIEPPSMSTSGARTLLKRLSEEADVPGLEDDEYLTLHGARRGVGEKLYRERGAAAAQRTLRHADPQTTSEMYSHIEASELAEDNTAVFDNE